MEKRTEQIAVRITPETKERLRVEAEKLDWTIAKLVERILREWTEDTTNGKGQGAINFIIHQNENIKIGG